MFLSDARQTGKDSQALPKDLCRITWQVDAGMILKAPVAAGGLVIAASLEHGSTRNYGFLRAFGAQSGASRWQFNGKDGTGVVGGITTTPVVADGLVLFGSGQGSFNAVELASGRLIWEFVTGGGILGNPAIKDGTIYFGSEDCTAYAVDVRSGTCRWKHTTAARIYAPLIVEGTTVYVADEDGGLYALNLEADLCWRAELGEVRPMSLALYEDLMLISDLSQGLLQAFDPTTRRSAWTFQVGVDSAIIPAVSSRIVCVSARDNVMGLDLTSGKTRWTLSIGGETRAPVIVESTVVIARRDGKIYGVDIAQGAERWTCEAGQSVLSEILIDESMLYFGNARGGLVAMSLSGTGSREFADE